MKTMNRSLLHARQCGSTLIEVLVSMFIVALGVMALMALQVRSAASIKEAENMSIIAQATQNLVESMTVNPTLEKVAGSTSEGFFRTLKKYDNYKRDSVDLTKARALVANTFPNQKDLADYHLGLFTTEVGKIRGLYDISVKVDTEAAVPVVVVTWKISNEGDGGSAGNNVSEYSYEYIIEDNR